jgi:predicted SnoaL-like aldol condensation-catalyzing enzyme
MADAKVVMRRMVDMFATGNAADAESVVAAEYVDHQGPGGPEGFRDLVRAVHGSRQGEVRVLIDDLIGEGDRAAARLRWLHTNPDGTVVERETLDVVRCANGKAVEHWGAETFRR